MALINRKILVALCVAAAVVSFGFASCTQREKPKPEAAKAELAGTKDQAPRPAGQTPASTRPRNVRPPGLVGSFGEPGWYPASPSELRQSIETYLKNATSVTSGIPMGLIIPHAGHRWSGQTAAYAYKTIEGKSFRRVFILAPNHTVYLTGAAVPTSTAFATPLGEVPVDTEVTDALSKLPGVAMDDRPHVREHDIEIQLPFLQVALKPGFRIVPILIGEIDTEIASKLAEQLRPFVGSDDLVIVSSDFTHYGANFGYMPFETEVAENLKKLDMKAFEQISKLSASGFAQYKRETGATVCGYHPILVFLSLAPKGAEVKLLRYDRSGDLTGDYSSSVSYLSIGLYGPGWPKAAPTGAAPEAKAAPAGAALGVKVVGGPQVLSAEEQVASLKLARAAVEQHVRFGKTVKPEDLGIHPSGKLLERYGVFVTLEKEGELRGCIGNILPESRLVDGIIGRAIDAAVNDYRFPPVRPSELSSLEVEVSVLTKPHAINSYREIVLGKHGVVLNKNGRGAVFLPQVAPEQHWTLDETLTHLSLKAGLDSNAWREGAQFEVFEAQVFREARQQ